MRVNRSWCGALLCGLLIAACAHVSGYRAQPQPDGSYRLDCRDHLTRCLTALEEVCRQGYEIVQAHEDVRYAGPREFIEPTITSVAIARCRTPAPVLGGKPAPRGARFPRRVAPPTRGDARPAAHLLSRRDSGLRRPGGVQGRAAVPPRRRGFRAVRLRRRRRPRRARRGDTGAPLASDGEIRKARRRDRRPDRIEPERDRA